MSSGDHLGIIRDSFGDHSGGLGGEAAQDSGGLDSGDLGGEAPNDPLGGPKWSPDDPQMMPK